MTYTEPRTWADGELETAAIFNHHVSEQMASLYGMIQGGLITITPVAGTPTTLDVSFPLPFAQKPYVLIGYHGASPGSGGTQVRTVGAYNESTTGFTASIYRGNTTVTELVWLAILPWGMV